MNHALGAGSIAKSIDQQSSALLCYDCPPITEILHPALPVHACDDDVTLASLRV